MSRLRDLALACVSSRAIRLTHAALLPALLACSDMTRPATPTKLHITIAAGTLVVGDTLTLAATITDASGKNVTVSGVAWSSSDTSIVTVDVTGLAHAREAGSATITAVKGTGTGEAAIVVLPLPSLAGGWEWSENLTVHDSSFSGQCADTGRFTLAPTGADFDGRAQVQSGCGTLGFRDSVSQGTFTDGHIQFQTSSGGVTCQYDGSIAQHDTTLLAGRVVCDAVSLGNAYGNWHAHRPWPVASVTINGTPPGLYAGDLVRLTAHAVDTAGASAQFRPVTWASMDTTVATVDDTGVVIARTAGQGIIVATVDGTSANVGLMIFGTASGVTATDLGTLGGHGGAALGVNSAGVVVGWSKTASGGSHAFRWTAASGMTDLGTLGGATSAATAINQAGEIVGVADASDGTPHAFRWTAAGGMQDLGPGEANAVSPDGHVAGGADAQAVLWDPAGQREVIGASTPDTIIALGVNDDLVVVGTEESCDDYDNCYSSAFRWTPASGLQAFGPDDYSMAAAIDSSGNIVGASAGGLYESAFVLEPDGTLMSLPLPFLANTEARGIGTGRQIAGCGDGHPVAWTSNRTSLVLTTDHGCAFGISGDRIVGEVVSAGDGTEHAMLWTAPAVLLSVATSPSRVLVLPPTRQRPHMSPSRRVSTGRRMRSALVASRERADHPRP